MLISQAKAARAVAVAVAVVAVAAKVVARAVAEVRPFPQSLGLKPLPWAANRAAKAVAKVVVVA